MKPVSLRIVVLFIASVLVMIVALNESGVTSASPFFSVPIPGKPQSQSSFLPYYTGGAISCGAGLSAVRVAADSMYTNEGGSEFFCTSTTPTTFLPAAPKGYTPWEKRGYLIGVYPFPLPLSKPINVTFEIDAARIGRVCSTCWSVRYYDPKTRSWQPLPTVFSPGRRLVSASISKSLPQSGIVKGYTDRALVMLFTRPVAPVATPTLVKK